MIVADNLVSGTILAWKDGSVPLLMILSAEEYKPGKWAIEAYWFDSEEISECEIWSGDFPCYVLFSETDTEMP